MLDKKKIKEKLETERDTLLEQMKGMGKLSEETGEWVLVDLGDIVVHVMQPAVRVYYNLEELWKVVPRRPRKKADNDADGE